MNEKRSRPITADERQRLLLLFKMVIDFVFYVCVSWIVVGALGILYGLLMVATHPGSFFNVGNTWIGVLCLIVVYPLHILRKSIVKRLI